MTREEAIKVASEIYGWLMTDREREALEALIPELAENDDERIRKAMVDYFSQYKDDGLRGVDITPWIAYLEKQKEHEEGDRTYEAKIYWKGRSDAMKQKEQKLINESNTHEPTLDEARKWNEAYEKGYSLGYENGRNEQKSVEWSEKDKDKLKECIRIVIGWEADHDIVKSPYSDFLKSLRPQPKQEWSDEDKQWLSEVYFAIDHSMYSEVERQAMKEYIDHLRSQSN